MTKSTALAGGVVGGLAVVEFTSGVIQGFYTPLFTDIARRLAIHDADINWLEAVQLLLSAIVVPVLARLGDMYGHRRVLLGSLAVTGLGSWGMAFAPTFPLFLVMFAVQALIFAVLAGVTTPSAGALWVPWTSPVWLGFTGVLTLVCTLGAYGLMNAWQPKITATEAGLIYCVEPIFGSLAALFLPAVFSVWAMINYANETATWTLLVGGGLVTAANILIQLKPAGKTAKA